MPEDRLFHSCLGHSDKVNALTDFEEIVWRDFINTADDFGVMRFSPVTLQSKFDRLDRRSARTVQKALERVRAVGLVFLFDHQERSYCYQRDWQEWQHVRYPRETKQPLPPPSEQLLCNRHTRWLFEHHPGGCKLDAWKAPKLWRPDVKAWGKGPDSHPDSFPEQDSEKQTRVDLDLNVDLDLSHMSTRIPAGGPPLDELLDVFLRDIYPKQGYARNWETEQAWVAAFAGQGVMEQYAVLVAAVAQQTRSIQWREGKIPLVTRWLKEQRWNQVLPEPGPHRDKKTTQLQASSEEFLNSHD